MLKSDLQGLMLVPLFLAGCIFTDELNLLVEIIMRFVLPLD